MFGLLEEHTPLPALAVYASDTMARCKYFIRVHLFFQKLVEMLQSWSGGPCTHSAAYIELARLSGKKYMP
jgi:hypothetical protein